MNIDWDKHELLQKKLFKNRTHFAIFEPFTLIANSKLNKYKQFQVSLGPRCKQYRKRKSNVSIA